jgi:uncharacterized protein with GYD domain
MAKYLLHASYTAEGLKGLQKEGAAGRREAIAKLMESAGCKLDALYYSLGEDDVVVVVDAPDIVAIASVAIAVSAAGLVRTRTAALMTVEEVDKALKKSVNYRPPGR